jgi:hypothetical protein
VSFDNEAVPWQAGGLHPQINSGLICEGSILDLRRPIDTAA